MYQGLLLPSQRLFSPSYIVNSPFTKLTDKFLFTGQLPGSQPFPDTMFKFLTLKSVCSDNKVSFTEFEQYF